MLIHQCKQSLLFLEVLFLIFLFDSSVDAESLRLPKEFAVCKRSDPKYAECLKDASQEAFTLLNNGIPSLGVEPLDPLKVKQIKVQQGAGAVLISLALTNLTITGMNNVKVLTQSNNLEGKNCVCQELRFNTTNCCVSLPETWVRKGRFLVPDTEMSGEVNLPEFTIISDYKINGKVLLLPVKGDGTCNVTMREVNVKANMKCEKFEREGEEFLNVTNFDVKIEPGKTSIDLGNLFGGDETLGKAMNSLINQNSRDIIRELGPAIADAFNTLFRDISNKIFHQVPHNTIFLP